MAATLPRRATAIVAAVALAGCAATVLLIVRGLLVPPLGVLWPVQDSGIEDRTILVTVLDTTGDPLIIYGTEAGATPLACSMRWIDDLPLQRVTESAPRQERNGISWRPLWETVGDVPPRGQEILATCTVESGPAIGNFMAGPRDVPQDSPRDWNRAAAWTGAATLLWLIVAAVVLVRRSA
ncbi:hypothetical protein [Microlunatus sp. GCM10028923]|uniref:hypothetical protein n=1 Tax=Microlunatus sp. GCM10028923 TaxID=3273400 RepID=UPI00360A5BCA